MKAIVFIAPNAEQKEIYVTRIKSEDREFFEKHGVKISMEVVGGTEVVYADTGKMVDGEPDELIQIGGGRSCEDVMAALRRDCEERFKSEGRAL